MFVTITQDDTDEILLQRPLEGQEILDCLTYAKELGAIQGFNISEDTGYCPTGCCDITVELAEHPQTGSCWAIESFFIASE